VSGSVNKVILIGNLGADPDLKYTTSNRPVCNLSIATNDSYKDKSGQRQERTEWHRVTVWGELGETCSKHLTKGRSVYLEGRLQTRTWENRQGEKRYATEIVADRVVFLDGGGDAHRRGDRPAGARHSERRASEPMPPGHAPGSLPSDEEMF
jgi:single-strand DNA-binding protein